MNQLPLGEKLVPQIRKIRNKISLLTFLCLGEKKMAIIFPAVFSSSLLKCELRFLMKKSLLLMYILPHTPLGVLST